MKISSKDVHIWVACDDTIQDKSLLKDYQTLLNEKESNQHKRFHFEKHRHQYLVTRALVRTVLSLYHTEIEPANWQFDANSYGKPHIANAIENPVKFNLSHTENMVVLAITQSQELGIDIEWVERKNDILSIPERYFSPLEVEHFNTLSKNDQKARFFDLWTLKEAYIKACGKGLSIPLDCFSFIFSKKGTVSIEFRDDYEDHPQGWRFWQLLPNNTHKIALALKNSNYPGDYLLDVRTIIPMHSYQSASFPVTFRSS